MQIPVKSHMRIISIDIKFQVENCNEKEKTEIEEPEDSVIRN